MSYQAGYFWDKISFGVWSPEPVLARSWEVSLDSHNYYLTDGSSTTSYSVSKNGDDGVPGKPGDPGQNGVGIEDITKYYLASAQIPASQQALTAGQPLCSRSHPKRSIFGVMKNTAYTNGTSINTTPVIIGVHGDNGAERKSNRSHRKRDRACRSICGNALEEYRHIWW